MENSTSLYKMDCKRGQPDSELQSHFLVHMLPINYYTKNPRSRVFTILIIDYNFNVILKWSIVLKVCKCSMVDHTVTSEQRWSKYLIFSKTNRSKK